MYAHVAVHLTPFFICWSRLPPWIYKSIRPNIPCKSTWVRRTTVQFLPQVFLRNGTVPPASFRRFAGGVDNTCARVSLTEWTSLPILVVGFFLCIFWYLLFHTNKPGMILPLSTSIVCAQKTQQENKIFIEVEMWFTLNLLVLQESSRRINGDRCHDPEIFHTELGMSSCT